jgi:hypothetical protein
VISAGVVVLSGTTCVDLDSSMTVVLGTSVDVVSGSSVGDVVTTELAILSVVGTILSVVGSSVVIPVVVRISVV